VNAIALLTHTHPEQTASAVRETVAVARAAGCRVLAERDEITKHGDAAEGIDEVAQLPGEAEACVVLGGDGTILKALRACANTEVPVFGINFGTVGFLAAVERDELGAGLEQLLGGGIEVLEMPGLEASVDASAPVALNDVSLIRRPHGRVAELSYSLGGREVGHVRCDGLVAATPAGSTGYNLANQGPILAWGVEGFAVSFIAPHTLTARALVVAPSDVLHVRNAGQRDSVEIAFDGRHERDLRVGDEVEVRFRDDVAHLAQLPGSNFYTRMREKFGQLAG
jgi:NAD+ kinase